MEPKNEALELAQRLDDGFTGLKVDLKPAAAMLRSQASEIERLKAQVDSALNCSENANKLSTECLRERDQLKAKNEKLVEALKHLTHNTKKSGANVGLALDLAIQVLKENT